MTANGSATSRELARRYFVIAGLDLPGLTRGPIHPLRKIFFDGCAGDKRVHARPQPAKTGVNALKDALLPAHDDSAGGRGERAGRG